MIAEAYFPEHIQRLQYEELSEQYSPQDPFGLKILMVALMKRAVVDVQRALQIREEKPPLQNLVRSGVIGDDMLEKINNAEKELESEIMDVVQEAEMYRNGWGKSIMQEASQLFQQQMQMAQAMQQQILQQQMQQQQQQQQANAHAKTVKIQESPAVSPTTTSTSDMTDAEKKERAERVAQELLEEEEKEKAKKGKNNKGKSNKKK